MFGRSKNKFKLIIEADSMINEKIINQYILEKEFSNRIKLSSFMTRIKFELKSFNKKREKLKGSSLEDINIEFPKMVELFQTKDKNYLFIEKRGEEILVDEANFNDVKIYNKKNKLIFDQHFDNIEEKELDL